MARAQYNKVVIGEVKVYSREPAAKDNAALQTKMQNWQQDARRQLETYTKTVQLRLPAKAQGAPEKVLVVNLSTEVTCGNRAMRYFVGFGAGKGGVSSLLSMADSTTRAEIFSATADSDLSVGAFGGDIGKAFTSNLEKLLQQYPDGANLTQATK